MTNRRTGLQEEAGTINGAAEATATSASSPGQDVLDGRAADN